MTDVYAAGSARGLNGPWLIHDSARSALHTPAGETVPGLVSIVLAVRNGEEDILRAVAGILSQSYPTIELLVVDDASSDGTLALLREACQTDERLSVVHLERNVGVGQARNHGLMMARGEFVLFVDHDDEFANDLVEQLVSTALLTECDVAVCGFTVIGDEGRPSRNMRGAKPAPSLPDRRRLSPDEFGTSLFVFSNNAVWNKLFRRNSLLRKGVMFPALSSAEDLVVSVAALANANGIAIVRSPLVCYRVRDAGQIDLGSGGRVAGDLRRAFAVIDAYRNEGEWSESVQSAVDRLRFMAALGSLLRCQSANDFRHMDSLVRESLRSSAGARRIRVSTQGVILAVGAMGYEILTPRMGWRLLSLMAWGRSLVRGGRNPRASRNSAVAARPSMRKPRRTAT